MKDEKKDQFKSFIQFTTILYETVYLPDKKKCSYYGMDKKAGIGGIKDSVVIDEVTYKPPQNNLAETGVMLLPSGPKEYGSFTDLLSRIKAFINRYLELPSDYLLVAACYVLLSWVFDCFENVPYLRARGDYGTGKSRFLQVIGSICYRPLFAGGSSTPSPIFRLIEIYGGLTLVLDEADFRFSGADAEIIKILNTGYMKGMGVLRTEGDKVRIPTSYSTYGPKILATRKPFDDLALESRCLTNYMTGMTRKDIPYQLNKTYRLDAAQLRNQLLKFRFDYFGEYEIDQSLAIEGVEPRVNQVLMPLFALVESEDVRKELRAFALKHAQTQSDSRSDTIEAEIFSVLLIEAESKQYISIKQTAETLNADRDRDQGEYKVSPAKIGRVNKTNFGFSTRKVNGTTEIIWDKEIADRLSERFGLTKDKVKKVDDVDLVDFFEEDIAGSLDENILSNRSIR